MKSSVIAKLLVSLATSAFLALLVSTKAQVVIDSTVTQDSNYGNASQQAPIKELCDKALDVLLNGSRHFKIEQTGEGNEQIQVDAINVLYANNNPQCKTQRHVFFAKAREYADDSKTIAKPSFDELTRYQRGYGIGPEGYSFRNYCEGQMNDWQWRFKWSESEEIQHFYDFNTTELSANGILRNYLLGKYDVVREQAVEALELAPQYPCNSNFGNAYFAGYTYLGLLAFRDDNILEAIKYLVLSSKGPGSPRLIGGGYPKLLYEKFAEQKMEDFTALFLRNISKYTLPLGLFPVFLDEGDYNDKKWLEFTPHDPELVKNWYVR